MKYNQHSCILTRMHQINTNHRNFQEYNINIYCQWEQVRIFSGQQNEQSIQRAVIILSSKTIAKMKQQKKQAMKINLVLRSPLDIQQQRRKYSADYKPRKNIDRVRQKIKQITIKRPLASLHTPPLLIPQSPSLSKRQPQLQNPIKNEQQYIQSNDQPKSFVAKKRLTTVEGATKREEISQMFKNIKQVIKQNQKMLRLTKQNQQKQSQKDGFLMLRSQLQQQLYKRQQNQELFKINTPISVSLQLKKQIAPLHQKSGRYLFNPFLSEDTITCNSAVLNIPEPKRNLNCLLLQSNLIQMPNNNSSTISRRAIKLNKPANINNINLHLGNERDSIYAKKLKSYIDFLFKVNYSNSIYVDLALVKLDEAYKLRKYKVYIGRGNNSLLVKSLIKRRFWWQITHNINEQDIDFYWSQNTIDRLHNEQKIAKNNKNAKNKQKAPQKKSKIIEQTYQLNKKIMSQGQSIQVQNYINSQGLIIPFEQIYTPDFTTNHLPQNNCIGSKKNLFKSLLYYHTNITHKNPFDFIPKTYHIPSLQSPQYLSFLQQNQHQPNRIWIVKPGQNTNRGKSIHLAPLSSLPPLLTKTKHENGLPLTHIIQAYLHKPLLYNNRKFDLRHYLLLTSIQGNLKAYWYKDGYIRTSSHPFTLEDTFNPLVHLTNDAVQKKGELYEKYQPANKLSYSEFQRYLQYTYPTKQYNLQRDVIAKMKQIATDIVKANYLTLDRTRLSNNFEIFGLDFMIDRDFKPWLIEVNYNPCLEVNCTVLQRVIPAMLENSLRLALDPLFPPPAHYPPSKRFHLSDQYLKHLKYELIFDQQALPAAILNPYPFEDNKFQQQQYLDDGKEVQDFQI